MWRHSGEIYTRDDVLYVAPHEDSLLPLTWDVEGQHFVSGSKDVPGHTSGEQGLLRESSRSGISRLWSTLKTSVTGERVFGAQATFSSSGDASMRYEAIYGLLPLGERASVMVLITEKRRVGSLPLNGVVHDIFTVSKLRWILLPRLSKDGRGADEDDTGKEQTDDSPPQHPQSSSETPSTAAMGAEPMSPVSETDSGEDERPYLSEATLRNYLSVVDRFCVEASENDESYLYFSHTINLASTSKELLAACGVSEPSTSSAPSKRESPHLGSSNGQLTEELTSTELYQWNANLLGRFRWPTKRALCAGLSSSSVNVEAEFDSGDSTVRHSFASSCGTGTSPWDSVCMGMIEAGSSRPSMTRGNSRSLFQASMLYIPCIIRGVVGMEDTPSGQLLMISRLSCRWSGTRYNRRGLEPTASGVVANFAITSLWLCSPPQTQDSLSHEGGASAATTQRVAVFDILRGSIPRRWEQRANLSLFPAIKCTPSTGSVEEVCSHFRLLHTLWPQVRRLVCLDTTASSKREGALSEAYASAVRKLQAEMDGKHTSSSAERVRQVASLQSLEVLYSKFNLHHVIKHLTLTAVGDAVMRQVMEDIQSRHVDDDLTASDLLQFTAAEVCTGSEDDADHSWHISRNQTTLWRVNCIDCLDRTNVTQAALSRLVLKPMMDYVLGRSEQPSQEDDEALQKVRQQMFTLFIAQGVAISQLYSGTAPHFVSYTRTGRWSFKDTASAGMIAARRWFRQNFHDGAKQDAVSLMTLQHDPHYFDTAIESPFARDLSSMNSLVMVGVLLAVVPFLYCIFALLGSPDEAEQRFHAAVACLWGLYFLVVWQSANQYRVTFTNRPLLQYSVA